MPPTSVERALDGGQSSCDRYYMSTERRRPVCPHMMPVLLHQYRRSYRVLVAQVVLTSVSIARPDPEDMSKFVASMSWNRKHVVKAYTMRT